MDSFNSAWEYYRQRTEEALDSRLAPNDRIPPRLNEAMRYVCLDGGKRFRALLVYACGELAGARKEQLDAPACAVEMIHAYSLTHDDLPAMDDDVLRRGKPTCHVAFDEATAILVGDALQAQAFEALSEEGGSSVSSGRRLRMVAELARASGAGGMVGGQTLDMEAVGHVLEYEDLVRMHRLKTGALIRASALLGGLAFEQADERFLNDLDRYASKIGLAFQIADDILDHTADSDTLGKMPGADERMDKATYVSILGLETAREEAQKLSRQAIETVQGLGDNTQLLEQLAHFVVNRSY